MFIRQFPVRIVPLSPNVASTHLPIAESTVYPNVGHVKYVDRSGVTVKAVSLDDEQHSKFTDYGKVFLRILDDDYNFKKTEEGKFIVAVKDVNELIQIGFLD